MLTALISFHVVLCVLITIVVLLQFGKGAEAGAVMGSSGGGASQNIFSASSKGNIVTKATSVMAILFVCTSLSLTYLMGNQSKSSIMDDEKQVIQLQRSKDVKKDQTATDIKVAPVEGKAEVEAKVQEVIESTKKAQE